MNVIGEIETQAGDHLSMARTTYEKQGMPMESSHM